MIGKVVTWNQTEILGMYRLISIRKQKEIAIGP